MACDAIKVWLINGKLAALNPCPTHLKCQKKLTKDSAKANIITKKVLEDTSRLLLWKTLAFWDLWSKLNYDKLVVFLRWVLTWDENIYFIWKTRFLF